MEQQQEVGDSYEQKNINRGMYGEDEQPSDGSRYNMKNISLTTEEVAVLEALLHLAEEEWVAFTHTYSEHGNTDDPDAAFSVLSEKVHK